VLKKLPLNMKVLRFVQKGNLISASRDYLVLNHVIMDPKVGSIETISGSIDDPICPPQEDCIRADIKIMGVRIVPTENNKIEVTMMSMVESKGNLPKGYNKNLRTTFYNVKGILRCLKKRYKNVMSTILT